MIFKIPSNSNHSMVLWDRNSSEWPFFLYLYASNCPIYPLFSQCSTSVFIFYLIVYCYSSVSISSPFSFFFFCPDSLRLTLNYYCNLLQVGIYRLRYPGVINKKPRSVCNFMNVIRALQLLQRVFLEFQKSFARRFPGSIFASITEYTIGFCMSYPPLP